MNSQHIDPEDLALFALQFLPAEQSEAIRRHLEQCTLCRSELAEIQGDLAVLALTSELHSPPAAARDRLLSAVAREPRAQATSIREPARMGASGLDPKPAHLAEAGVVAAALGSPTAPSISDRRDGEDHGQQKDQDHRRERDFSASRRPTLVARVLPWTGWAVAAALAVIVGQARHERDSLRNDVASVNHQMATLTTQTSEARRLLDTLNDPTAQRVTLTLSKQTPVPQGKATYVPDKAALVFVANNMEPLEPSKTYELWIIPTGGQDPVPAGTFHPDSHGNASVILPRLPEGVTAKAFGITIENEGGSRTPTMPIIMAGAAG